jgi:O-antigen/teichoic acid export membrane protein
MVVRAETRRWIRLARNYASLIIGECIAKLFTFVAFTIIGRRLGPERYGQIEFTLAIMVFFTLPVDFGLGSYGAREIAKDPSQSETLLSDIPMLRLVQASFCFLILLVFAFAVQKTAELRLLLVLYGASLFLFPALLQWFLQAYDRMNWVAAASMVRYGVFAGCIMAFARPSLPLWWIGIFECTAVSAAAAVCLAGAGRCSAARFHWHGVPIQRFMAHIRSAGPIGLAEVAWAALWYLPTVLLGFLAPQQQVGWYTAAHRVVMGLHTFVWLYFFNMLPSLSRCVPEPKSSLRNLISGSLRITTGACILGGLAVTVLARPVASMIYGEAFAGAGRSLAVLIWLVPLAMFSGHYRFTLLAYDLQKELFAITLVSAVVATALCFPLIPAWGATGAAAALVAGNVVTLVLVYRCVRLRVAEIGLRHLIGLSLFSHPQDRLLTRAAPFGATTVREWWRSNMRVRPLP